MAGAVRERLPASPPNAVSAAVDGAGGKRSPHQAPFTAQVGTILWKEILTELRRREIILSLLVFSVLVLLIFDFAFDLRATDMATLGPGVLWVTFVFAGVLGLNRAFALERDRGTMDGLLLAPVDRGAIYLAKLLANAIFMLVVELVSVVVFIAFFNPTVNLPLLAGTIVLATIGFSAVGTLFAAMSANTRAREVLLPVLLFPVSVPVLIAAVQASALAFGASAGADRPWLGLIAAYDAIFLAVSFAVFDFVLEE
ncbi:MAG: heme exporter protein CcmB [Chloroflexota bacterium]|nr:heme exporter protein CcmB [Chloroflexota bacterium]